MYGWGEMGGGEGEGKGGMCVYQKDIYVSSPVMSIGPLDSSGEAFFFTLFFSLNEFLTEAFRRIYLV